MGFTAKLVVKFVRIITVVITNIVRAITGAIKWVVEGFGSNLGKLAIVNSFFDPLLKI